MARTAAIWILALAFSAPALAAELKIEDIANDGCQNEPRLRVTFDKYCHKRIRRPVESACGGAGGGSGGGGGMAGNGGFSGISGGTADNGLGGSIGIGGGSGGGGFVSSVNGPATISSPSIVPPVTPVPGPVVGRGMIWAAACLVLLFLAGRRKYEKYRRTNSA